MSRASPMSPSTLDAASAKRTPTQWSVVAVALAVLAVFLAVIGVEAGVRQGALLIVGVGLGLALYHAAFGFTAAYRRAFLQGRTAGLRAQIVMLAVASIGFAPLLAYGDAYRGAIAPIGVSLLVGAFIFGLGMQLAGGCGSGTLYTMGGGSTRMIIVLAAFITGSYVATWHVPWWQKLPSLQPVALYGEFGWAGGLALQGAALALIYALCGRFESRRHGTIEPIGIEALPWRHEGWRALLRGPWPLVWGAIALALLNIVTLLIAGRPWGITGAFALWGAKLAGALGHDPTVFEYWRWPGPSAALQSGLAHDITSVMDLGLVLGAWLAAGLAGRFAPSARIGAGPALAAIIGGLMLGYGARLSYGCNIGAFFSGVASGSLHGWVWIAAALAGTVLAIPLRPRFGLANEARA